MMLKQKNTYNPKTTDMYNFMPYGKKIYIINLSEAKFWGANDNGSDFRLIEGEFKG